MRKTENIINRTGINKTECKKNGHSKENKIPGVKCTPKIELYLSNFKGALHWWNGSLFFLIIILGITLGIFAGCKNIFVPESPATPEAAGPGGGITVPLRLFTGSARSVMPGMEDITWEITATSDSAEATVLGEYPDFKISFPSKGKWTIEVKGKSGTESDAEEIFTGNTTLEITGSTTSISIPLSPGSGMGDGGATGSLNLTIKRQNVNLMSLNYRIDGSKDWESPVNFGEGDYTITYESLPVGRHTLDLYFSSNSDKGEFYFCTVAVNIWPGMTSNQWIKTSGEEYITDDGEFVITGEMVDKFVKTMGSVVFVDENVDANTPGTGSIYAPVNSVSTAVDILRKVNPGRKCNGTIMVSGETTIEEEIDVNSGETLTIKGMGADASIKNTSGRVFNIASDGSLTLEENITLTGKNDAGNGGAVYVNGGTFTMKADSKITGSSARYGGGVYVDSKGIFTMGGGAITENSASIDDTGTGGSGGGVCISYGTFTMSGGAVISGNSATGSGGGVFVSGSGKFTMEGGTIGGFDGDSSNSAQNGGGVYIFEGTFTMSGGAVISGNSATSSGGGVYVGGDSLGTSTFTMSDSAVISGNSATSSGGGVYVYETGEFTMEGGTIGETVEASGNSSESGGGVCVYKGYFTMSDGSIRRNTATDSGGGVFVQDGTFDMKGSAVIQGNKATSTDSHACGGGVYVNGGNFTMSGEATIQGNNASTTHTGSAAGGGGVYVNGGTFTMTGTAKIQGNTTTSTDSVSTPSGGGGVFVIAGGTFTMSGGTIGGTDANEADLGGGVYIGVNVKKGSFTMSGGTIKGNTATQNGGGVYVAGGTFTMNDGTIGGIGVVGTDVFNNANVSGGGVYVGDGTFTMNGGSIGGPEAGSTNTAQYGGGVYVWDGTFTMNGGIITGNTATQNGGGVYVSNSGSFEIGTSSEISPVISGNTKTDNPPNNVYLYNGKTLSITGELQKTVGPGNIGISMAIPGVFTSDWSKSGLPGTTFFFSDDESYKIKLDSFGECELVTNDSEVKYEVSGSTDSGTFAEAVAAVNNSTDGGTITLLKDIDGNNAVFKDASSKPQPITFRGGTEAKLIILDLNGFTINRGLSAATAVSDGSVIKIEGGALTIKDSSAINPDGTGGTGTITGGNSTTNGGGICIENSGSLTLENGSITGNKTGGDGGGVYFSSNGTFTMSGGIIQSNVASNETNSGHGGGVCLKGGTFTMSGTATIADNEAVSGTSKGGGIYLDGGTLTMTGDAAITGNEASKSNAEGGGIYLNSGTFNMIDGEITGNKGGRRGGGVYFPSKADVIFNLGDRDDPNTGTDPVIRNNTNNSGDTNNVFVESGALIEIVGDLLKNGEIETEKNIGISKDGNSGDFAIHNDHTVSVNEIFSSDQDECIIDERDGKFNIYIY